MSTNVPERRRRQRGPLVCLVFASLMGSRLAEATPTDPCEAHRAALAHEPNIQAPSPQTQKLGTQCHDSLANESKALNEAIERLKRQVHAGQPVRVDDTSGQATKGVADANPAGPAPSPPAPSPQAGGDGGAIVGARQVVVTLSTLKTTIRRAVRVLDARRFECKDKTPCADVILAERDLLTVSALAIQATYVPCAPKESCPNDTHRAALLGELGVLLAADVEDGTTPTAVKKARALGLSGDMIFDLLALAERGQQQLSELSLAADEAARNHQAPADVVEHAKAVIKAASEGTVGLWQALKALPSDDRARVTLLLQSLANPGSRHVPAPRLRLAVLRTQPSTSASPTSRAETDFLYAIKEVLVAMTDMATRPEEKLESRAGVTALVEKCQHDKEQACDGVLEIAYQMTDSTLTATGRIHFLKRPETKDEVVEVPIGPATASSACSGDPLQAQAAAAYSLIRRLSSSYSVVNDLAYLGYFRAESRFAGRACQTLGAKIFELPLDKRSPKPAIGFVFEGKACAAEFSNALREEVGRLSFFRDLTDRQAGAKAGAALASGALVSAIVTDPQEIEAKALGANCEVSLRDDAQSAPYYALRAYWKADAREAGVLAGAQTASFLIAARSQLSGVSPALKSSEAPVETDGNSQARAGKAAWPNAFWAFASPGLPWLADGVDSWNAFGVALSSSDVALLAGAAASYGAAAEYRYQLVATPDDPSLARKSETARNVGAGLLIAAGALRVAAFIGYLASPPSDQDRHQSLAKALAQPLTWSF